MKTKEKIIAYLKDKGDASANELVNYLGISRTAVFNQLKNLLLEGTVKKIGKPPKVFYLLKEDETLMDEIKLDDKIVQEVSNGEIGIKGNIKVSKNSKVWIKNLP